MTTRCVTSADVVLARREVDDLAARLGIDTPPEARPGADLAVRARRGIPWPVPAPLLRVADGWVHPGPPTAWRDFADLVAALGASWPDLGDLSADAVDAEAAAWMLPTAAVRAVPAAPDPVPELADTTVRGASVVLLGTAWATPLTGLVLVQLGARVVKVEHPRRPDPFPLRDDLVRGQQLVALDLDVPADRDRCAALVADADLLVVGHPPRVLDNAGIVAPCATVQVAAFHDSDRPGYGPAAEAHGGWAARHDPPRLGRTSVADPVAGLVAAVTAVHVLHAGQSGPPSPRARVSLEGAVGRLLERERRGG
jgi:hypothetical protein